MVYNNCEDTLRSGRVSTADPESRGCFQCCVVETACPRRRLFIVEGAASISVPTQVPVRAPTLSSADLKLQASSAGRFYGARALGRRWDSAALESCDGVERHADRPRAGGEVDEEPCEDPHPRRHARERGQREVVLLAVARAGDVLQRRPSADEEYETDARHNSRLGQRADLDAVSELPQRGEDERRSEDDEHRSDGSRHDEQADERHDRDDDDCLGPPVQGADDEKSAKERRGRITRPRGENAARARRFALCDGVPGHVALDDEALEAPSAGDADDGVPGLMDHGYQRASSALDGRDSERERKDADPDEQNGDISVVCKQARLGPV